MGYLHHKFYDNCNIDNNIRLTIMKSFDGVIIMGPGHSAFIMVSRLFPNPSLIRASINTYIYAHQGVHCSGGYIIFISIFLLHVKHFIKGCGSYTYVHNYINVMATHYTVQLNPGTATCHYSLTLTIQLKFGK